MSQSYLGWNSCGRFQLARQFVGCFFLMGLMAGLSLAGETGGPNASPPAKPGTSAPQGSQKLPHGNPLLSKPLAAPSPTTATPIPTTLPPSSVSGGSRETNVPQATPTAGKQSTSAESAEAANSSAESSSLTILLADFRSAGMKLLGKKPKEESSPLEGIMETAKGSSSSTTRKAATAELPLDQLKAEQQVRVRDLLAKHSYYRRLPTLTFAVQPDVYQYFIDHPESAASMWRAMEISKLQLKRISDTLFEADTGDGTSGTIELLHRGADTCFITCEGAYKTPFLKKPIQARSLLFLKSRFTREADGVVYVTHRADLFVEFPSQTIEAVSKVLTPVAIGLSDRTFAEMSVFLRLISSAMATRPDWVEHITAKMEGIPEVRKHELLVLTAQIFVTYNKDALAKVFKEQGTSGGATPVKGATERETSSRPASPVIGAAPAGVPRSTPVTAPEPPAKLAPPPVRITRRPDAGPIQN